MFKHLGGKASSHLLKTIYHSVPSGHKNSHISLYKILSLSPSSLMSLKHQL